MINLLPPQEKKFLLEEQNKKLIIIWGILFFVFLFCLILTLGFTKIYISGLVKSQETILKEETERLSAFGIEESQKRISQINKNLLELKSYYQSKIFLTQLLERISKTLPPGIYLTDLTFSREEKKEKKLIEDEEKEEEVEIENQISLFGFASSREILFQFRQNLEQEKTFKEIYFPASNWIKSENIDFYLTFKVL